METTPVYVLITSSINDQGVIVDKNVGVTMNIFDADAHAGSGHEHTYQTFNLPANWKDDSATTSLILEMRGFVQTIREEHAEALR